ncbi:MAG: phosphotransferase [Chloroflexi bacterium]|nr:phosphotransferase [Chloroflexota bacterium]
MTGPVPNTLLNLSYEHQRRRLRSLAETVRGSYDLQDGRLKLLTYEDNAVYQVQSSGGQRFVLHMAVCSSASPRELRSEMTWLEALHRDTGLAVPEPIRTSDGRLVGSLRIEGDLEVSYGLLSWIPGKPLGSRPSLAGMRQAGDLTARLHEYAHRWSPPADFLRPTWDLDWVFGPSAVLSDPSTSPLERRAREVVQASGHRLRHELGSLATGPDIFGLLHADINLFNVLIDRERVGLIDFDDCGWSHYPYDLAVMLYALRFWVGERGRDSHREATLRNAFLGSYFRRRPSSNPVLGLLPSFMAMRALILMRFSLQSPNSRVQQWAVASRKRRIRHLEEYLDGQLLAF